MQSKTNFQFVMDAIKNANYAIDAMIFSNYYIEAELLTNKNDCNIQNLSEFAFSML